MKYALIALAIYVIYRVVSSYSKFVITTGVAHTANITLEVRENEPIEIAFKRGILFMIQQNYLKAEENFQRALNLVNQSGEDYIACLERSAIGTLQMNISFCRKPLPWSSGKAENKTGSYITYLLIDRFGDMRFTSYRGLNDDMSEAHEIYEITNSRR